jgi:hypothetical protein
METRLLIAYLLIALLAAGGAFAWRYTAKKQRERRGNTHRSRPNKPNNRAKFPARAISPRIGNQ